MRVGLGGGDGIKPQQGDSKSYRGKDQKFEMDKWEPNGFQLINRIIFGRMARFILTLNINPTPFLLFLR